MGIHRIGVFLTLGTVDITVQCAARTNHASMHRSGNPDRPPVPAVSCWDAGVRASMHV